jgi:hypothetical protein
MTSLRWKTGLNVCVKLHARKCMCLRVDDFAWSYANELSLYASLRDIGS